MLSLLSIITSFAYLIAINRAAPAPSPVPAGPITAQATYLILTADINQPWSSIQGVNPETFSFTVVGQWAGSTPVTCTLNWNAGVVTITDEGQKKVDATFNNCTDPNVEIDMKRYRIEPWFLWEITIQARYVLSC